MNDVLLNEKIKFCFLIITLLIISVVGNKASLNVKFRKETKKQEFISNNANNDSKVELNIGKPGTPFKKLSSSLEEIIPFISASSNSNYIRKDKQENVVSKYDARNLLLDEYWFSAGNHGVKQEVTIKFEFKTSERMSAIWLYWAYAPGEFRIRHSNVDEISSYKEVFPEIFRYSIEKRSLSWWKKILANPMTRWQHKSFDDRIQLEHPVFAKYIILSMRIPVNQYFGLYKIEFYKKIKTVAMLRSKARGLNYCMLLANGEFSSNSTITAANCMDAVSYGDNRDLFMINSNGYITPQSYTNKCVQSPEETKVELEDCSTAEEYRDDRNKWQFEYTGLIRSKKNPTTCLSLDANENNYISSHKLQVNATSTQNDGRHSAEFATDYFTQNYWASEQTSNRVLYFLNFKDKAGYVLKSVKIEWKFPAKKFQIIGLLPDGNTRTFFMTSNNRDTITEHSFKNTELKAVHIIMYEASMKVEGTNIYAITNIYLHIPGRFVVRQQCEAMIDDVNLWEIIDVHESDTIGGLELKKSMSLINDRMSDMKKVQKLYEEIPKQLLTLVDQSNQLTYKLKSIEGIVKSLKGQLLNFESIINSMETNSKQSNTLGDNQLNPAVDCAHIKIAFPHKRSGFYWIKSDCMPKSMHIYCDFYENSQGNILASDFHIIKLEPKDTLDNFPLIRSDKNERLLFALDIRKKCAEYGLEAVEIKTKRGLSVIFNLIDIYDFNFDKEGNMIIIPIALDYGVELSHGIYNNTEKFTSFNTEKSLNLREILDNYATEYESKVTPGKFIKIIKDSIVDKPFDNNNLLAIGNENNFIYTRFQGHLITGLVCSSNIISKIGNSENSKYVEIKCDTNFHTLPFTTMPYSGEKLTSVIISCPKFCGEVNRALVYGSGLYTDNSSICRAAIHAGVIKDSEGGVFEVKLMLGSESYEGSTSFNIESLDYKERYPRGFTVGEYKAYCPIDKYNSDMQGYKPVGRKLTSFITLEETVTELSKLASEDELKLLVRFFQKKSNIKDSPSVPLQNTPSSTNVKNQTSSVPFELFHNPPKELTTDEALVEIDMNIKHKTHLVNQAKVMSEKIKVLVATVEKNLIEYRDDKERGLTFQEHMFSAHQSEVENVKNLVSDMSDMFMLKINKAEHDFLEMKSNLESLTIYENYQEDYTNQAITSNYHIYNNPLGSTDNPASWDYYQLNLKGHNKVIVQRGAFQDNRTGSHLVIKNRDFYDFELKFSVFIGRGNEDTFGVAFRYVNEFTYYIFEMSRKGKGFKRLRKFMLGEQTELLTKHDGGYMNEEWIYVKVHAEVNNFKIYTAMDSTNSINNAKDLDMAYELIFDVHDNSLTHGSIAFTSLGLNYVLLDDINVIQLSCTDFSDSVSEIDIKTSDCARYTEDFKHMWMKYKSYDPPKWEDGPAQWKKSYYYDSTIIKQNSAIYGTDVYGQGAMDILKKRPCQFGQITVKIQVYEEGSVGIPNNTGHQPSVGLVFKFQDENNFYVLEVMKNAGIRIRKKIDGIFSLLGINSTVGYQLDQWFKIILEMKNHYYNVYFFKDLDSTTHPIRIFDKDLFDSDLDVGSVGFWTFKTPAMFGELELTPIITANKALQHSITPPYLFVDEDLIDKKEIVAYKNSSPSSEIKDKYIRTIESINNAIPKFSWGACLLHENSDTRMRMCSVLFNGSYEIEKCQSNFCGSCCNKQVESTNPLHKLLCNKQCRIVEKPLDDISTFDHCFNPLLPENSVYSYCDKVFINDFHKNSSCKSDMCKLCCVSFDMSNKKRFSEIEPEKVEDKLYKSCEKECIKKFIKNRNQNK